MDYIAILLAALPEPIRIIAIFFLLVLGLLWLLLPFAVVSIQRQAIKSRELNEQILTNIKETNRLLYKQNHKLDDLNSRN